MRLAFAALLALGACVPGAPEVRAPQPAIQLDAGGIAVLGTGLGTGQRIDFGRDGPGVIQTMTRLQGRAPERRDCPGGGQALVWRGGLELVLVAGAFQGWQTDDPAQSATGALAAGARCA